MSYVSHDIIVPIICPSPMVPMISWYCGNCFFMYLISLVKIVIKLSQRIYKYQIIYISMDYVYILSIVCCGALFFVNRDNKRYIADLHTRVKIFEISRALETSQ